MIVNQMKLSFMATSANEGFARSAAAAFLVSLDPTVEELADIRTAVSEAVTNAIVHGYREEGGTVLLEAQINDTRRVTVRIRDRGCGIPDISKAMEPLFTTSPEGERAGLGFAVMQSFMDKVTVRSTPGKGTVVTLTKQLAPLSR